MQKASEENVLLSDIPSGGIPNQKRRYLKSLEGKILPLPPEDQFILKGEIFAIFSHALTTHNINDVIVSGLLKDPTKMSGRSYGTRSHARNGFPAAPRLSRSRREPGILRHIVFHVSVDCPN